MVGGVNSTSPLSLPVVGEARANRTNSADHTSAQAGDTADIRNLGAPWRAARESIEVGLAALDLAIAGARDALSQLSGLADAARDGEGAQAFLDAYQRAIEGAASPLLTGGSIEIVAEPGAASSPIVGVEARLGAAGAIVPLDRDAGAVSGADLVERANVGAQRLSDAIAAFERAGRTLEAHAGFLRAAEGASGVRSDLDAEGARLLALQVSQDLRGVDGAIANAQPSSVLAHFRAGASA